MQAIRSFFGLALLVVAVFGAAAIFTPGTALAGKGGKGKGGQPDPPAADCPCDELIELAPGVFCELEACAELVPGGYECLYTCPFTF